jgi:1-acyl-sn-glycerol-3-phosphate acyltransferase
MKASAGVASGDSPNGCAAENLGMTKPPNETMDLLASAIAPWRWLTSPVFRGLERVPEDRPLLFVGNHTLMGALDIPLMMVGLWEEKGIQLHPLGDHLHFNLPGWRDLVAAFGVIQGTPENCRAAMSEGKSLVVFPGGAREVMKRRDEKYKLVWGKRAGFARLALECGYTIQPFAAVGADDCWDILYDGNDMLASPLGGLIERYHPRPDFLPPILRGVGGTILPRAERFYFHLGEPIATDTSRFRGRAGDPDACFALREEVRWAVENGLTALLAEREKDPQRGFGQRLRAGLRRLAAPPESSGTGERAA